jgi:hypothetical protein
MQGWNRVFGLDLGEGKLYGTEDIRACEEEGGFRGGGGVRLAWSCHGERLQQFGLRSDVWGQGITAR